MSYLSNLTLALSVFKDSDIVASISKDNSKFYHVYYKKDGQTRVMLVPREVVSIEQLQHEVRVLISRNPEEQARLGALDGAN
jgi:hypothetical protein